MLDRRAVRPDSIVALVGAALAGVGAALPWHAPGAVGERAAVSGLALGAGVVALLVAACVAALVGLGRRSETVARVRPAGTTACGVVLLGLAAAGFATAAMAHETVVGIGVWATFAGGTATLAAGVRERAARDDWTVPVTAVGVALLAGGAFAPWADTRPVVGLGERAGVAYPEAVGSLLGALAVLALVDLRARGRVAGRLASRGIALLGGLLVGNALAAVVVLSRRGWTEPGVGLSMTLAGGLLVLAGGLRGGVRDGTWRSLVRAFVGREVRVAFAVLVAVLVIVTADPFRAVVRSFDPLRSLLFVPVGLSFVAFDAIHATYLPGDEAAAWLQFLLATYLVAVLTGVLARRSTTLARGRGARSRLHPFAAVVIALGAVTLVATTLLWAHGVDGLAFQGLVGFERVCLMTREAGSCRTSLWLYGTGFGPETASRIGAAYLAAGALAIALDAAWHRLLGTLSADDRRRANANRD